MTHEDRHSVEHYGNAFALGILLNIVFVLVEFWYGLIFDSLALVADAGHNVSDVLSLIMIWGASLLAERRATPRRTYGFRKLTILAPLASSILLLVVLGGIAREAITRFSHASEVRSMGIVIVAGIGFVINGLTAFLFLGGQRRDLNIKGAFLHMAADAGVSLGVVTGGVLIHLTGMEWIDPALSLIIVGIVLLGTWRLFKETLNLVLDAVPSGVDVSAIREYLEKRPGVSAVHDLHVWALSSRETALTAHLVCDLLPKNNDFISEIRRHLKKTFGVGHTTIQIDGPVYGDEADNTCPTC